MASKGPKIGYMGLGNLGSAIVPNVAAYAKSNNLPPLALWNRSSGKYEAFKETMSDSHFAQAPEEMVERCNLIMTCLVNDQAVEEVYGAMVKALKGEDAITFVDSSTIKPITALKVKKLVEDAGATYITSPVFGQPAAAKAKQLVTVTSGKKEGRELVKPIMAAIGKHNIDAGDDNAKGSALKLMGNSVILGTIQLYAEAYALGDAIGFDPTVFHELHQNVFAAPALLNYSNKISQGAFGNAGFTVSNGLKDADYILNMGKELGHDYKLPTIERAQSSLKKLKEQGDATADWSAIAAVERVNAGLSPWRDGTNDGKQAPK